MKEQLFLSKNFLIESSLPSLTAESRKPYADSGVIFMSENAGEQASYSTEKFTSTPLKTATSFF